MSNKNFIGSVMVVGGGISGIQASLDLAESGYKVYLIEQSSSIGGVMAQLDKTFPTNDCSMCIISPKLVEAGRHINIELFTMTKVELISGSVGNFNVTLKQNPRYIDLDKCTSCGECAKICPISLSNNFNCGLNKRKAAFKSYPQAMPSAYAIDKRGTAPCKLACPLNPSIQGCIALMRNNDYERAFKLFRQEHPFPGICGRVCNHPCENICNRSKIDQPVSIMALHRFLADWAIKSNFEFIPEIDRVRDEKIAIVGSGPAGLACAYFLALYGFKITVFEKSNVLGGMLILGIPPYRLPRDIIDMEINTLKKMGIKFKIGITIGEDLTINQMREQGYKAFFLAVGAHIEKKINIQGNDIVGVYYGLDYLYSVNIGKKIELGDRVVVIGGGNVAFDAVRTAFREGAKNPFIVYRRSISEMPANEEEIKECLEEGIEIKTMVQPVNINEGKNGSLILTCVKIKFEGFDESKRPKPVPIINSEYVMEVDSIIFATGQESEHTCLTGEKYDFFSKKNTIKVNPVTFQTNSSDIFAGGDMVSGPSTVVEALGTGKKASKFIKEFVLKEELNYLDNDEAKSVQVEEIISSTEIKIKKKEKMPLLDVNTRKKGIKNEVQLGFDLEQVNNEVDRCLLCGICSECYLCVEKCLAGAINHNMKEVKHIVEVGSIILSPGFTPFNSENYEAYNYALHANVITSLEFERILSASGPYQGKLIKPSDGNIPSKIAWLQCVGSRDINNCDNDYCSSVCCMYANKQAIIAKEHSSIPLDTTIFFMDMRTFGKDFDKYVIRGQENNNVRVVRSRIHSVIPIDNDNLKILYATESGGTIEEQFDMVVLSVGLTQGEGTKEIAKIMGIELDDNGYAKTKNFTPVNTSRDGIYVCGSFQEPKDIPMSVMEASASSACVSELLSKFRWTLTNTKSFPQEVDISKKEPRVAIFVCNCGINIGGIVNIKLLKKYSESLSYVVHVEENLFTCSQDSQDNIINIIKEKNINRVVVASCSPRTHEPLFQETIRNAGLNQYLFEMANIRDQNSWVHMHSPDEATNKAKDLVRMAVAKVVKLEPLYRISMPVVKCALIIGGGIAGMEAALSIAKQDCNVVLIEKSDKLGGNALHINKTWRGENVREYVKNIISCIKMNNNIKIYINAKIEKVDGVVGNFITTIINGNGEEIKLNHGVVIVANGGIEYKPKEYLYENNPNVLTHLDLDDAISKKDLRLTEANNIVFIQCVGSRIENRPYCSKVCCTHSLKTAIYLKEINPNCKILIIYRDIRSYGFREKLYQKAREKGIFFIRYDLDSMPKVFNNSNGSMKLKVIDHVLSRPISFNFDLLVLASGILPSNNKKLSKILKIPVNIDGFFLEAHAKLKPVDSPSDGIFLAGLTHYPKPIEESIAQAKASVSRAMVLLSNDEIYFGGVVAEVDPTKCSCCLTCVRTCPYGNPFVNMHSYADIEVSGCRGCGICVSECPGKAIELKHFTDIQILAKVDALFK